MAIEMNALRSLTLPLYNIATALFIISLFGPIRLGVGTISTMPLGLVFALAAITVAQTPREIDAWAVTAINLLFVFSSIWVGKRLRSWRDVVFRLPLVLLLYPPVQFSRDIGRHGAPPLRENWGIYVYDVSAVLLSVACCLGPKRAPQPDWGFPVILRGR